MGHGVTFNLMSIVGESYGMESFSYKRDGKQHENGGKGRPPPSHKYNSGNLQRNVLMCSFIHMGLIRSI